MAPRGAQHRDLEQRLRDMEDALHDLTTAALSRERLEVTEGDFRVTGGGGVEVVDGSVDVRGDGHITWHDPTGRPRFRMGRQEGQQSGGEAVRLVYYGPAGNQRAILGQILDAATGQTNGHGLLIEGSDGADLISAHEGGVYVGRADGQYILDSAAGDHEDYLNLSRANGDPYLQTGLRAGVHGTLWGGAGGNGQLSTALQLRGTEGGAQREVRVLDGAISAYAPIAASEFDVRSSSGATKEVLGTADTQRALDDVRQTPIRRWRHLHGGGDAGGGEADQAPVRLGPLMEEASSHMRSAPGVEGGGIKLAEAVWTLWSGVQHMAAEQDDLRTQVANLTERLERLERLEQSR